MFHVEINGCRIHYRFDGSEAAPVVVLSNSLGTNLHMWDSQIPALSEKYRVLRYDSRGHGHSTATPGPYAIEGLGNDVVSLLDALHIDRVFFCGISLGGVIAQWLGVNAPDRLNRLIACDTAAKIGNPEFWNKRIAAVQAGGMEAIAGAQALRWFTEPYVAKYPEVIETMKQGLLRTPANGYIATCEALRDSDLRESIHRITTPTLLITGAHDAVTPPADGRFIAAQIPGARYVEVNGSHLSNIEDSAAFSAALLQFISQTEVR
jgi:3-oxoadipate enol-lactonase